MNSVNAAFSVRLKGDAQLVTLGLTTKPDGTARIYKGQAPQTSPADPVALPYGIYQKQSGTPSHTHEGENHRNLVYLVKFVDTGNSSVRAGALDARADEVLTEGPLIVDGNAYSVLRISDIDYPEDSQGAIYQHVGGLYRLVASPG